MEAGAAWQHPSPRLRRLRHIQVAAVTVALAAAAGGLGALAGAATVGGSVATGVVAAGVLGDLFAQRRVRAWAYCERGDDLLVRRGILVTRLSVVPYGRMQFVDVTAGPFERAFGLATVRMHTAAAASDARIPGLSQADAARLRDHLAARGESQAAGI